MSAFIEKLAHFKIIPVVTIENADDTEKLCNALMEGGLPCAEITFRTEAAPEAIKIASKMKEMTVGAGTVLTKEQAAMAVDCGANFIVSPGFGRKTVEWCVQQEIPVFPGVCTPTEIQSALEFNIQIVKFFPAENYGGLATVKALSAPFPQIQFIPTGGINAKNIQSYLAFKKVIACGGSWMVTKDLINEQKWDEIKRLTEEAVTIANQMI